MDYGSMTRRFNENPPQGVPNQLGGWMQNYQNGNYDQVPHDQVHQAYTNWANQAPPEQVQEATQWGFQQVPQQQQPSVAGTLHNFFQQHGLNPQDAGVQTTDPNQTTPNDMARMAQHAQQQQPDAFGNLFKPGGTLSNPLVGMAVAGALAYGASKFLPRH
ncbi:MAG: hypothetical protein ACR2M0_05120 [Chloroflexia bacterium]